MSERACRPTNRLVWLALFAGLPLAAACASGQDSSTYQRGEDLPSVAIGDGARGELLFTEKSCVRCHAYEGTGGTDARPLDFMQDKLTATELANMSGTIWNHLPQMVPFFEDEAIPLPTFSDDEMPDLVAYLHGESLPHDGAEMDYRVGDNLLGSAIGDSTNGARLFDEKSCSDCHSYDGAGGDDASALDFMKGDLSATELAAMSGRTWNHVPHMVSYFEVEGIPVPKFEGDEMADLVAYLHEG